jgi:hypothetical protein
LTRGTGAVTLADMRARHARAGLLATGLLLLSAAAAWPASTGDTRIYSTGTFVVNCTSTGQVCSPPKRLTLTPPRKGTMTSVHYTTPPQHCSALVLQVVRNGNVLATSDRIEAGEQSTTFPTSIKIPKGESKIGFRAKGFLGGCNTGRVGSWGGKVTVKVKLEAKK